MFQASFTITNPAGYDLRRTDSRTTPVVGGDVSRMAATLEAAEYEAKKRYGATKCRRLTLN